MRNGHVPPNDCQEPRAPHRVRHGFEPDPSTVAELPDQRIREMDREEMVAVLHRLPTVCLERRVRRRLQYFDAVTLRRLLFLCRRCERNLMVLDRCRPVPNALL